MSTRRSLTAALVLALSAAPVGNAGGQGAKQKREAAYQSALQSYTEALKPGMARKDVEDTSEQKARPSIKRVALSNVQRSPI
jgi:hypothetical protein